MKSNGTTNKTSSILENFRSIVFAAVAGFIGFIVISLAGYLFGFIEDSLWSILGGVLLGMAGGAALTAITGDEKNKGYMILFITSMVMGTALAIVSSRIEVVMFNISTRPITLVEVFDHSWSTVFHFREGSVRSDLAGSSAIMGRSGKTSSSQIGTVYVAPVVPDDWKKDQTVFVWAVDQSGRDDLPRRKYWKEKSAKGLRVIGATQENYRKAIAASERIYKLYSAKDAVLVHWTNNADETIHEARMNFLLYNVVFSGIWILLFVILKIFK